MFQVISERHLRAQVHGMSDMDVEEVVALACDKFIHRGATKFPSQTVAYEICVLSLLLCMDEVCGLIPKCTSHAYVLRKRAIS